ncbi:MAG: hypothetical protein ABEJ02_02595 [Candidatus Paceibacteria bacterium]
MLEQIAYEVAPRLQRPQSQSTYQVSYLENLSATALYRGSSQDPTDAKNQVKSDGTIETILPKFQGEDTVKIYIDPLNGDTKAGYHPKGDSHSNYSKYGPETDMNNG